MNNQQDPLAIYRIGKHGIPSTLNAPDPFENQEEDNEDPLNQYRIAPPESKEYGLKDIPRVAGGLAARAAETAIGIPGSIQAGAGAVLDLMIGNPIENFTGKEYPKLREGLRSAFKTLPTGEEIKEKITKPVSEYLSGDENLLEPQGSPEEFAQDFTRTFVEVASPGGAGKTFAAKVGLAFAGSSGKEVAKQLGFSPSSQELAKFGTLGILSLAQIGNAPKYASELFQSVKSSMPRGVRFNCTPLQNSINRIKQSDWYKGHSTPSTAAAREMVDAIEKRIENGTMSASQGMQLRENINEMRGNLGAYKVEGGGKASHIAKLNEVQDALIHGMEQTLGQQYPSWWKQYQNANQAYAITKSSSAIGNFIANNYGKPIMSDAGKILFGNALAKGAAGVAKLGIAGVGIATGAKAISLANRIWKSPILRKYYNQVIQTSLKSDSLAMMKALEKFDEEALKEQKLERSKNVLRGPSRR